MPSSDFTKEVLALTTSKVFLTTLVLDHPDWRYTNPDFPSTLPEGPLYLIDDVIPHTISTVPYTPYGFTFTKQTSNTTGQPVANLRIEDVDRQLSAYFRVIKSPATITISVILADNPTQVELGPFTYNIDNVQQTGTIMSLKLTKNSILVNRLSGFTFSADYFPGLFL